MARAGGEVAEERPVGIDRAEIAEVLDGAIREVRAEVVAVVDRSWRRDRMVVVVQRRHELVGLAAVEPVPPVEAARERPGRARRGHVGLVLGREVPLPDGVRRVSVRAQDLREEAVLAWNTTPVAREPDREIRDPSHAVAMVVAAGHETRTGRRAQRGRMEVREPEPVLREAVERRRRDVGAVAAELGEADVVEHEQQHVRRTGLRFGLGRPPRGRRPPVVTDHPVEALRHAVSLAGVAAPSSRWGRPPLPGRRESAIVQR